MNMTELIKTFNLEHETSLKPGDICSCGREHTSNVREIYIERGALARIPGIIEKYCGSKVFIIADVNTYNAAGKAVCEYIENANIPYSLYIYDDDRLKPDEKAVGKVILNFDGECDFILGIGSGTINDIGKLVAYITGFPYMIAATAPSMDGYASETSSVIRDGIKISVNSACPTVIVADLDVISQAPLHLIQAGIGDMLAKYISICEWKYSHIITGEFYCENIASIVRIAVKKCLDTKALLNRDPKAIKSLIEGLIISGIAMSFAGVTRPASGMEHYFSHLWDMRALEFNTPSTLHGIQCGIGTLLSLKIYEFISKIVPDKQKALDYVKSFSLNDWNQFLGRFLGKASDGLIELEKREGKYDLKAHAERLDVIIDRWDEIRDVIVKELPSFEKVEEYMKEIGMPTGPKELGYSDDEVQAAFLATKDVRNKYIGSRLLWDLGFLEEASMYV